MKPHEKKILDHKFVEHLTAKGYPDHEARKLVAERRKLNDEIFGNDSFVVVNDKSKESKRFGELNRIIFSAIN